MNPVKTLCFTLSLVALLAASAAAQTLYFYPPGDPKWVAGRSYISQGSAATAVALDLVTTGNKCGWYEAKIPSSSPLRNFAQFWLGKPGIDRIGPNGIWSRDFEPTDDFSAVGGVFKLGDIFAHFNNPSSLYFVAEEVDANDPWAGWYTTDPAIADPKEYNDGGRCKFELAAFIYDTDASVHPDFSCGRYGKAGEGQGNGPNTYAECQFNGPGGYNGAKANLKPQCTGVVQGLAAPTLNAQTRKIECGNCTKKGCWTSADWFKKAFEPTQGVNVRRCYDMPFTQVKSGAAVGSFEFDSDTRISTIGGKLIGGFFPEVLTSRGTDDYSKCTTCDTKRDADRFPPLIRAITKERFDAYESKEGDFNDGDHPPRSAFGQTGTEAIYDWTARDTAQWFLHGTTAIKNAYGDNTTYVTASQANEHFCFESHADFYYDPSQEFYFSGDDDIWVYINNKLVIDLGGNHMAAPGHIKLSTMTPALEEGKLYPIDIFFCDKRTANSNVRITTNMYVVQKSAFNQMPDNSQNVMCAAITGGASCESKMSGSKEGEMCGKQLIDNDYIVDFFMVNRVTKDTIYLSGPARGTNQRYPACTGTTDFKCGSGQGITVTNAVYKCGGFGKCRGNQEATANVGIQGSFNVYARLMNKNGTPVTGAKDLLIDSFKGESNDRIVWGTLAGQNNTAPFTLKDAYGGDSRKEQNVVAGKWIPVYISTGSWGGDNAFEYDDDPEVAGHAYKLTVSGGAGLTIYKEKGGSPIGTTSASGALPASGVDTLWVKADYDIGEKSFSLNVTGEGSSSPSMIINVKQPRLQFRDGADGAAINNPSGWAKWGAGGKPPVVGNPLDVYIVAIDPVTGGICDHCNFSITQKSESVGTCKIGIASPIVRGDKLSVEGGKLSTYMRGQDDTGADGCTATWKIYGESDETNAQWTLLRFRESPVPVPLENYIYDRNGDGIGDKVEIKFNKSLISKGDSLYPIILEIEWEKGNLHHFYYNGGYTVEQLKDADFVRTLFKNPAFLSANAAWWKNSGYLIDSITIVIPKDANDPIKFSKDILTTGTGKVSAYIPYIDTECSAVNCNVDNAFSYSTSAYDLRDKISPIIVKAEYVYASNNKGDCEGNKSCKETFTVWLSEAVFAGPDGSGDLVKNPFSYCLGHSQGTACPTAKISVEDRQRQDYNNNSWPWELPNTESSAYSATYKQSKGKDVMAPPSAAKGDSVIELIYYANGTNGTVRSPKADDWVKLRSDFKVFQDAQGNTFAPRERGVLITGSNPSKKKPIHISQIRPDAPSLNGTFADGGREGDPYFPSWIGKEAKEYGRDNLFRPGNITEFLPVPKHINNTKDVMLYYPSSVGTLFDIADNFHNEVGKVIGDTIAGGEPRYYVPTTQNADGSWNWNGTMEPLSEANVANFVSIKASAYYHTNLGNYTAHRDPVTAKCTDKIFRNAEDAGNCYTNEYNYYMAWDLKDNKGRAVGAGAYVGISKFQVELRRSEKNPKTGTFSPPKTKTLSEQEFIEMFGVKRTR